MAHTLKKCAVVNFSRIIVWVIDSHGESVFSEETQPIRHGPNWFLRNCALKPPFELLHAHHLALNVRMPPTKLATFWMINAMRFVSWDFYSLLNSIYQCAVTSHAHTHTRATKKMVPLNKICRSLPRVLCQWICINN